MSDQLDADLIAAHAAGDGVRLAALYEAAGDQAKAVDAACFYWVHAMVFALETGLEDAKRLRQKLAEHGREEII